MERKNEKENLETKKYRFTSIETAKPRVKNSEKKKINFDQEKDMVK